MAIKALVALITVIAGVGLALIAYWLLNKLAELFPGRWEDRVKPFFYILPAYAAITLTCSIRQSRRRSTASGTPHHRNGSGSPTTPACCRPATSSEHSSRLCSGS